MMEMSTKRKIKNAFESGEDFLPKTKSIKPIKSNLQDRLNLKPIKLANLSRNDDNPLYQNKSGRANSQSKRGVIKSYRSVNLPSTTREEASDQSLERLQNFNN